MANFLSNYAVPIAIGAVALVLMLGLTNMMRGGSPNTSQKLMRLRVLLQFIAIIVIMTTIWVKGGPHSDDDGHSEHIHFTVEPNRLAPFLRAMMGRFIATS